jgi:hypothetical protein
MKSKTPPALKYGGGMLGYPNNITMTAREDSPAERETVDREHCPLCYGPLWPVEDEYVCDQCEAWFDKNINCTFNQSEE